MFLEELRDNMNLGVLLGLLVFMLASKDFIATYATTHELILYIVGLMLMGCSWLIDFLLGIDNNSKRRNNARK